MQMLPVYWIVLVKWCRCSHNLCWLQKLCPNLRASSNYRCCDCCFPPWRHCIWPPLLFWLLVVVVCCCSECSCDWKCKQVILHLYLKQSSEFSLWLEADICLIDILVKTRLNSWVSFCHSSVRQQDRLRDAATASVSRFLSFVWLLSNNSSEMQQLNLWAGFCPLSDFCL